MIKLYIPSYTPEINAIIKTIDTTNIKYDVIKHDLNFVKMIVSENTKDIENENIETVKTGVNEEQPKMCEIEEIKDLDENKTDENDIILVSWNVALFYVSRLAHTFPSDPLNGSIVLQWLMLGWNKTDKNKAFEVLEEELSKNTWLGGFYNSTAADFLWQERLRCENLDSYPALQKYMELDPVKTYEEEFLNLNELSDFKEPNDLYEIRTLPAFCNIS